MQTYNVFALLTCQERLISLLQFYTECFGVQAFDVDVILYKLLCNKYCYKNYDLN